MPARQIKGQNRTPVHFSISDQGYEIRTTFGAWLGLDIAYLAINNAQQASCQTNYLQRLRGQDQFFEPKLKAGWM
jgi:hypothetical protein